jgi:hypothetical protein
MTDNGTAFALRQREATDAAYCTGIIHYVITNVGGKHLRVIHCDDLNHWNNRIVWVAFPPRAYVHERS